MDTGLFKGKIFSKNKGYKSFERLQESLFFIVIQFEDGIQRLVFRHFKFYLLERLFRNKFCERLLNFFKKFESLCQLFVPLLVIIQKIVG